MVYLKDVMVRIMLMMMMVKKQGGGIRTQEPNAETIEIGIVRLGHVAKVKLYLFSLLSLKTN